MISSTIDLVERGLVPDRLTRMGIRSLLRKRLRDEGAGDPTAQQERLMALVATLRASPLAVETDKANEQHYEVPAAFYQLVLGSHLKYSSALWPEHGGTLDQAEHDMLATTCARAQLADGQRILELGCGWGSLTLWMGSHYPQATIVAVSNSHSQRAYIMGQARARGLSNVTVITADLREFQIDERFERVVSVECFEHLRNYHELFRRIATWLKPGGKLFVHIFSHRAFAYPFSAEGEDDWMGRNFFSGGIMPADQLFLYFQEHLAIEEHWRVNGAHYARTARAWLDNLDRRRGEALSVFAAQPGPHEPRTQVERWRMFFMACEELFGFHQGREWLVSHYRFTAKAC